jgi:3alpha(or 20beta)-hydroxysteroid dehydrogenase
VYQQVIATNQVGCFLGLKAVIPTMKAARSGSIAELETTNIPLGRLADPTETSALVSFLASTASVYITGTDLVIDGGIRARI